MPAHRSPRPSRARQWSRTAWAMALLLLTLPLAGRLVLGVWAFQSAIGLAALTAIAGAYLHIRARRFRTLPDPAAMLDEAHRLASLNHIEDAVALLSDTIRQSPWVWQAFQYRGELYLLQTKFDAALADFDEAIRLAPAEPHLHALRAEAQRLSGLMA